MTTLLVRLQSDSSLLQKFQSHPVAATILIGTLMISLIAMFVRPDLIWQGSLIPERVIRHQEYHRLLTHGFLHYNIIHLVFNLISYYNFAFILEEPPHLGHLGFLIVYVASMLGGTIPDFFGKNRLNPNFISLGASGAVSGLLLSFVAFAPNVPLMVFPIPVQIPAWVFAILFLVFSYFMSRQSTQGIDPNNPSQSSGISVAHLAHLMGALTGFVTTFALNPWLFKTWLNNLFGQH